MTRYPYPYQFQPDEDQKSPRVTWAIVTALLLLVAVVIFIAPRDINAPGGILPLSGNNTFSANPEIGALHRFQQNSPPRTALLIAPDPLQQAYWRFQREQARAKALSGGDPELRAVARYEGGDGRPDSAFLARNPEVALYYSYLAGRR